LRKPNVGAPLQPRAGRMLIMKHASAKATQAIRQRVLAFKPRWNVLQAQNLSSEPVLSTNALGETGKTCAEQLKQLGYGLERLRSLLLYLRNPTWKPTSIFRLSP
jgi:hypothetical protein